MAYVLTNLAHETMQRANQAFKDLRFGFLGIRKVKVRGSFIFSREEILQQLDGSDYHNNQIEVFITLENGEIFVYLDGQSGGGSGGGPQGVAKSPG
jgi:hypothetical protein